MSSSPKCLATCSLVGSLLSQTGQSLPSYPLKVEAGLLYIEVSTEELALGPGRILEDRESPPGPGHDPCLFVCPVPTADAGRRA